MIDIGPVFVQNCGSARGRSGPSILTFRDQIAWPGHFRWPAACPNAQLAQLIAELLLIGAHKRQRERNRPHAQRPTASR